MIHPPRLAVPLIVAVASFVLLAADGPPGGRPEAPRGFTVEAIAHVNRPRELVVTPNGDLLAGSLGRDITIVPNAEGHPGTPETFAHLDDDEAAGLALDAGGLYVGTTHGVWSVPYATGDRRATGPARRLAAVRTGGDGGHSTTSVAVSGERLFAGIGSSCNACNETDTERATIVSLARAGGPVRLLATHIRNAIALAVDPVTHDLWAGAAGQDELAHGHPYEIFDDVSAHPDVPDYGWPVCYEDRRPARSGATCEAMTVPCVAFPAYETPIGATFYPAGQHGRFAFPSAWRGGAFVALHGSWHQPLVPPRVVFVPIDGRNPAVPVDWHDPNAQWRLFLGGWQLPDERRIGRPTGIAVGPQGSLFVADDDGDTIYRVRPAAP